MVRQIKNEGCKCKCKENDKQSKGQFINCINDDFVTNEIIRELTSIKNLNEITSKQVLIWGERIWS